MTSREPERDMQQHCTHRIIDRSAAFHAADAAARAGHSVTTAKTTTKTV